MTASKNHWKVEGVAQVPGPSAHFAAFELSPGDAETRQFPHGQCVPAQSYDDDLIGCQAALNIAMFAVAQVCLYETFTAERGSLAARSYVSQCRPGVVKPS